MVRNEWRGLLSVLTSRLIYNVPYTVYALSLRVRVTSMTLRDWLILKLALITVFSYSGTKDTMIENWVGYQGLNITNIKAEGSVLCLFIISVCQLSDASPNIVDWVCFL